MCFYSIVVPRSKEEEWGQTMDFETNDSYDFTNDEYCLLRQSDGLYARFSKEFEAFIDDYEEDVIEGRDIDKAISIIDEYMQKDASNSRIYERVKDCFLLAKERGVFVAFVNMPHKKRA